MSDDEVKRHIDVIAERMEERFDLLAEAVQHVDSKIDRKIDALTTETRTGFRELGARIDVSVAQLGDRIAALENSQSALEARVAKLEAASGQTS